MTGWRYQMFRVNGRISVRRAIRFEDGEYADSRNEVVSADNVAGVVDELMHVLNDCAEHGVIDLETGKLVDYGLEVPR